MEKLRQTLFYVFAGVAVLASLGALFLVGLFLVRANAEAPPLTTAVQAAQVTTFSATPIAPAPVPPTLTLPPALNPPPTASPTPAATTTPSPEPSPTAAPTETPTETPTATPTAVAYGHSRLIGVSVQGRLITSYQFKNGPVKIVFVGGIHGGYEWNTITLAYEALDYFMANPDAVPDTVSLFIIPSANPDGQYLVTNKEGRITGADIRVEDTFPGRMNGNGVDLNRNWDCLWTPNAFWRNQSVNAGPYPFSEPENSYLRDFLLALRPAAVVFWHSKANAVFAAGCPDLYQPAWELAQIYGVAAGYPVYEFFTSYSVTGDASDWLATEGIPAITVELRTQTRTDWSQNEAGMRAVLRHYGARVGE